MADITFAEDGQVGDPNSAAALRKAQEVEYGTWIATEEISINGVRAFNKGDAVPVSHVERLRLDEAKVVAKRSTKAGQAVEAEVAKP